jgi:hypothetical protein
MSSRSALIRFFVANPILGGIFLIVVAAIMVPVVSSSGEKYQPFFDGAEAAGRVSEVGQGAGQKKYAVEYSWHDAEGALHRGELQSSKSWVGQLSAGDQVTLKLSADDPGEAIPLRALEEKGLVHFMGKPAPSIIYLSPILLVGGILMIVFHRQIGRS